MASLKTFQWFSNFSLPSSQCQMSDAPPPQPPPVGKLPGSTPLVIMKRITKNTVPLKPHVERNDDSKVALLRLSLDLLYIVLKHLSIIDVCSLSMVSKSLHTKIGNFSKCSECVRDPVWLVLYPNCNIVEAMECLRRGAALLRANDGSIAALLRGNGVFLSYGWDGIVESENRVAFSLRLSGPPRPSRCRSTRGPLVYPENAMMNKVPLVGVRPTGDDMVLPDKVFDVLCYFCGSSAVICTSCKIYGDPDSHYHHLYCSECHVQSEFHWKELYEEEEED